MNKKTWTKESIHALVSRQREFFRGGKTMDVNWRIRRLISLREALREHEEELLEALYQDLGRAPSEGYFCDIGTVILEINETIRGLKKWARPEIHFSGLLCFPSLLTKVYPMPYGVTLIISPFNFPFMLSLGVLAASIAGGNTAVIKASSKSPHSTAALKKLIADVFPPSYAAVVDGGHDTADLCLDERFDKIFYTGSPGVGRHVMEKAAANLTPVALELGGENGNWCVVRADADLKDAARKIAFFKMLNAGQICININQVAVAEEVADEFIALLAEEFERQIGGDALINSEYPRLINRAAYDKCAGKAEEYRDRVCFGGYGDPETNRYAPTILYPVGIDEDIVKEELFCPLLPVVTYPDRQIQDLMDTIAEREHGLALYLFTSDIRWAEKEMKRQQYGGGCINEVCLHLMVKGVPFGGTGHSGMGSYHGRWGFREFTHPSTVLMGSRRLNLPLREHPYGKKGGFKETIIKLMER